MLKPLRSIFRPLRRHPFHSALAMGILAIGLASSTGVFAYLNTFSQPFPGIDPDRLFRVYRTTDGDPYLDLSYPDFLSLKESRSGAFEAVVGDRSGLAASVRHETMTEVVFGQTVTGEYFQELDVDVAAGRVLRAEDDRADAEPTVLISYGYWTRRFSRDPEVVGNTLILNNNPYTIVGVAGPEFDGSEAGFRPEIWFPLQQYALVYWARSDAATNPNYSTIRTYVRLAPGTNVERAQNELEALGFGLDETSPLENGSRRFHIQPATWIHPTARESESGTIRLMLAAAAGLLLLACANAANILLGISLGKQREIALRSALGATPGRLVAQLLGENLLLAAVAGTVAFFLAGPIAAQIGAFFARPTVWGSAVSREVVLDSRVFFFGLGVSLLAGLVAGIWPALRGARPDVVETLKSGNANPSDVKFKRLRKIGIRDYLVSAQVAMAVILLIVSGLVLRTLASVSRIDPGFDTESSLASFMTTSSTEIPPEGRERFYRELIQHMEGLQWVRSATVSREAPIAGQLTVDITVEGQSDQTTVTYSRVAPGFFNTLGIDIVAGRAFTTRDSMNAPDVAIVNQAMVDRYFPGGDALGKRIWWPAGADSAGRVFEIIGVAANSKLNADLNPIGPVVFQSYPQHYYRPGNALLLSTTIAPEAAVPLLEQELRVVNPRIALLNAEPYSKIVRGLRYTQSMNAQLFSAIAVLGLVLAAAGIFGAMNMSVGLRSKEIGIRMALGAEGSSIARMVLGRAAGVVGFGIVVGVVGSMILTRAIGALLIGVEPIDPISIIGGTFVLVFVGAGAAFIPMRRAVSIDPVGLLRSE